MTRAAAARVRDAEVPPFPPDTLADAARGDGEAWRLIVEAYGRRVFALAKSRLCDPEAADEITQSVFATLAEKLGSGEYEEQGRFEAWLFRITMNRIRDVRRRRPRRAMTGMDAALEQAEEASTSSRAQPNEESARVLGALREAMDDLSSADREIVELRHHGRMSFRDMADLLEEPMGTLLARHHRALRKLRASLEEAGIDGSRLDEAGWHDGSRHE